MKKVLITGAGSYIGTSFEKYINQFDGYFVETFDMIGDKWKEKDFSSYDVVFHVAGIAHQKETKENAHLYYEVNRDLAVDTAKKAKANGVKQFIFLSSMSVYGVNTGVITKDTEPKPKSHYGKSKLEAEQAIFALQDESFKVSTLRPPMVYGKNCKGNYNVLSKIALKLPLFPKVKNQRSMLYIDNLCEFVRLLIDNGDSGLYFPQNDKYVNTTNFAQLIRESNGKKLHSTRIMNPAIKLAGKISPLFVKAFGSLVYESQMSIYSKNYNIVNFEESVKFSEQK